MFYKTWLPLLAAASVASAGCSVSVPSHDNWALRIYAYLDCADEYKPWSGYLAKAGDTSGCKNFNGTEYSQRVQSFAFATSHPGKIYAEFFSKPGCNPRYALGPEFKSSANTTSAVSLAMSVEIAHR
ncbi:hypothetical protein BV22DRAFT_1128098 [Leucogyrophana mollusca]|uniref:Uncharacterized protein n=1 Tax=Leucogyrophana mollusca TaxID=85980 RepID=A0ACB8BNQ7_9AGAM|nr:hypothetical protein BV22DRAFT_1128098 [Leucogyrophana mollusca]